MRRILIALSAILLGYLTPTGGLISYYLSLTAALGVPVWFDTALYYFLGYYFLPLVAILILLWLSRSNRLFPLAIPSLPVESNPNGTVRSFTSMLLALLFLLSLNSTTNYLSWLAIEHFFPETWLSLKYDFIPLFATDDGDIVWSSVLLASLDGVIIAPLMEELIFRFFLYLICRHYLGALPAAILSSLLFAAIHQFAMYALLSGLFLCYVYEKTRSFLTVFTLHASHNGLILLSDVLYYLSAGEQYLPWVNAALPIIALQSLYVVFYLYVQTAPTRKLL